MGVLVVLSSEVSVVTLVLLTTARLCGVIKVIILIVITNIAAPGSCSILWRVCRLRIIGVNRVIE